MSHPTNPIEHPSCSSAWESLETAILQERFDKLPELFTAKEFAEFSAEPIALIREAIGRGDIVATRNGGLSYIPKVENERLIRYRLAEDSHARVPTRSERTPRFLTTQVHPVVLDLVANVAQRHELSVRQVIETAVLSHWAEAAGGGSADEVRQTA